LFNHAAIFPRKHWPVGIGVNGWVRVDGEKMSKSLGNMIPLKDMADKFGPDSSRLTILSGGEGVDDANWDSNFAKMVRVRLENMYGFVLEYYGKGRKDRKEIDNWLDKELNEIMKETEEFMEKTMFRSAIQRGYFDLQGALKWYLRRAGEPNKEVVKRAIETQLLLLSPFAPFVCEEIWSKIGKKKLISVEKWPEVKKVRYKGDEEMVKKVLQDLKAVFRLVKFKPKKAFMYVIPKEKKMIEEAEDFFGREVDAKVFIYAVDDRKVYDPKGKAKKAKPGKPAIFLE
jgi:leucyl-tRNA synthetase